VDYLLHILIVSGIYVILTISLNLLVGYTGLAAFGHAAFSCVGAYTSALLAIEFGASPWLGLIAGGLAAAIVGVVVALPALRVSGDYLALATLGFAVIVHSIARNWTSLTRGPLGLPGIPRFSLFGLWFTPKWCFLLLIVAVVLLTVLTISRIVRSPFGRVLAGIREDELATQAMGKDVHRFKIKTFAVGACFAGVAGSLYAHYITFIDPSSFTIVESITILLMVVFGGMASLKGSFLGALILVLFPELLRFVGLPSSIAAPMRQMLYGLLLVALMTLRPRGLIGRFTFG